jgi:hypothetical protein
LLNINSDAAQIFTSLPLFWAHNLHPRHVRLNHQPSLRTGAPFLPLRRPRQAQRVGIVRPHEAQPVRLDDGDDRLVFSQVARPAPAVHVGRAPDGVLLGNVRHAVPGLHQDGHLDVVEVVPARGALVAGYGGGAEHVRAHVAHIAVGGAGLAPVAAGIGELLAGGRVEGVDFVELLARQGGELGVEEGVELPDRVDFFGREAGAAVGVVAEDGGDAHELAVVEGAVCVVSQDVFVDHRVPHKFGGALAAVALGVGDVDIFDLDFAGRLGSEAGECVFDVSAVQLV